MQLRFLNVETLLNNAFNGLVRHHSLHPILKHPCLKKIWCTCPCIEPWKTNCLAIHRHASSTERVNLGHSMCTHLHCWGWWGSSPPLQTALRGRGAPTCNLPRSLSSSCRTSPAHRSASAGNLGIGTDDANFKHNDVKMRKFDNAG